MNLGTDKQFGKATYKLFKSQRFQILEIEYTVIHMLVIVRNFLTTATNIKFNQMHHLQHYRNYLGHL